MLKFFTMRKYLFQFDSSEPLESINMNVEKVTLQISYECLCPYSRELYYEQLVPLVRILGFFINFLTYPYGKAKVPTPAKLLS